MKKSIVRRLVSDEKLDFIALQETKLEVVSSSLCNSLSEGHNFGFSFLLSVGKSGGILFI